MPCGNWWDVEGPSGQPQCPRTRHGPAGWLPAGPWRVSSALVSLGGDGGAGGVAASAALHLHPTHLGRGTGLLPELPIAQGVDLGPTEEGALAGGRGVPDVDPCLRGEDLRLAAVEGGAADAELLAPDMAGGADRQ